MEPRITILLHLDFLSVGMAGLVAWFFLQAHCEKSWDDMMTLQILEKKSYPHLANGTLT